MGPLMGRGQAPEMEMEAEGGDERQLNSDLVFETARAFLYEPEMHKQVLTMLQGTKDIGTAIGKAAALVAMRITKELETAEMGVPVEDLLGADGGLTKILVILYKIANDAGMNLRMEDTLAQAYDIAERDVEAGASMGQGQPPASAGSPAGPPPGPGLMGGMTNGVP